MTAVAAWLLAAAGGTVIVLNWRLVVISRRDRHKDGARPRSLVPFIGGVLAGAGAYLLTRSAWIALAVAALDPGLLITVFGLPIALLRKNRAKADDA